MANREDSMKKVTRELTGIVVSDKADKTVSVDVERIFQHPVYKKIVRRKKRYHVHDEANKCKVGDKVKIQLVRPISKLKNWIVVEILSTTPGTEVKK